MTESKWCGIQLKAGLAYHNLTRNNNSSLTSENPHSAKIGSFIVIPSVESGWNSTQAATYMCARVDTSTIKK